MPNDQYISEASTSRCKNHMLQLQRTSTSNHTESSNFNDIKRKVEIEQLEGRLKVLQEEAEMLKWALLESVEESRTLITDIHLHLNTIQSCLLQRGSDRGESYRHGVQTHKERRAGLMQILYQEPNPSIVNKGLRTKAILQDSN